MATRLALPGALAGLVIGITATDAHAASLGLGAAAIAVIAMAIAVMLRSTGIAIACAALAIGLLLGSWRGAAIELPSGPGSVGGLIGRGEVELVGTVLDDPRPGGSTQQVVLDELVGRISGGTHAVRGRVLATLPRAVPLTVGQRVGGLLRTPEARILEDRERTGPAEIAATARRWLLDGLQQMVPEPEAALGAGILLGVRSSIAPEISDDFAVAGLTHVVAISGWNIAIVAAIVGALLRPLEQRRGGRWLAPAGAGATIAGYVVLTGASPSVVRAALMAGAMMVGRFGGSRAHAASALGLAALVMLLVAPAVLWDVGFQLSALATAGLILFAGPIEGRLAGWPAWLREPIALTLAAQLTTLPVVVGSFGRLSLIAPVANVLVVPLVPLVMLTCAIAAPLGALSAALQVGLLTDAIRWAAGGSAWLLLHAMILAGRLAASVPLAAMPVTAPGWLAMAWYPALGLAWRRQARRAGLESAPPDEVLPLNRSRPRSLLRDALAALVSHTQVLVRPAAGIGAVAVFLIALTAASMPDGQLHLIALDVGQGDAILVMTPSGSTMLIDGGPDPDLLLRRLGERLPWWHRRIDILILTHPHQDHVAGLVAALEQYEVGLILDTGRDYANPTYPRFLALARSEPGGRLIQARTGQRLHLDAKTTLTLLYPTPDDVAAPLPESDINNASVVALLRFGGFTALLTGDAHIPVEDMLADRGLLTRIDVLKVGHHGSHSSTGPLLLAATDPRVAIISCGIGNAFGHPHQVTLDHLLAVPGLRLHRTDLEGSIEVTTDGLSYQVRTRLGTDRVRSVVAAPITANRPARSIGAWPYPPPQRPSCCLPPSTSRTGSSPIPVASASSRQRRRASSRLPGSRSIRTLSRSPPCCTT